MDLTAAKPDNRRSAYVAFAWVLVFLAWHVVWYLTGLGFPTLSNEDSAAGYLFQVVVIVMTAVGTLLPLAFAMAWGRRLPRWLLLTFGWIGFAVLALRAVTGTVDTLLRVTGVRPNGLTALTLREVMGVEHPTAWDWIASCTTDALFIAGTAAFGLATLTFQRATM